MPTRNISLTAEQDAATACMAKRFEAVAHNPGNVTGVFGTESGDGTTIHVTALANGAPSEAKRDGERTGSYDARRRAVVVARRLFVSAGH